jgi:predicted DNA-binding ribbon-helix-helix protein
VGRRALRNPEVMTTIRIPKRLADKIEEITNQGETKARALERCLATYSKTNKNLSEELKIKNSAILYYHSYCKEKYHEKKPQLDINSISDLRLKVLKWIAQKINSFEDLGIDTHAYIRACSEELSISETEISEIVSNFYSVLVLIAEQENLSATGASTLCESISENSETPLTAEECYTLLFLFVMDHKNFLERLSSPNRDILSFGNNL